MKNVYLVLAIVGAVVPYLFFFQFIAEHGVNLPAFLGGVFANGAAGGFGADLLITSLVFWIYLYQACLLYTSPSPRDATLSRMPSSA